MYTFLTRGFALTLMAALLAPPFLVLAQETDHVEELPVEPEIVGEILATSTEVAVVIESPPEEPEPEYDPSTYIEGEVVVKFENDETPTIIETTEGVESAIDYFEANPNVEYAEPNFIRSIEALSSTTDTYAERLWSLENTGQDVNGTVGTSDADIDAPEAWTLSTGTSTIIAVIDTGVFYNHPDLAANMWDGSSCVTGDLVPIPGGCPNHGYDFANNDNNPLPSVNSVSYNHGTHVAGIIAAAMNNHEGIIGVAPNAKIMALRFGFDTTSEAEAIRFATANGAKIINASYSGVGFSQNEYDAITEFKTAGGIFIAAAANGGQDKIGDNLDALPPGPYTNASLAGPAYPAQYDLENIISVAATTQSDTLAAFSNYGAVSVDLGAPGINILSASSTTSYVYEDGTSMATPHVSGVAALLKAYNPNLSFSEIKSFILTSGDALPSLAGKTVSGKRVNAYAALLAAQAPAPDTTAPVITLLGENPMNLTVGTTFIDPGATALDAVDGDRTSSIMATGDVEVATTGTYVRTYVVSDLAGNTATSTRDVIVSAPVSSGGGGGGGGGGSSKKKSSTKSTNPVKTAPDTPQIRLPQTGAVLGTTTAQSYVFTLDLALGASGAEVTELQKKLSLLGHFSALPTGYFGPLTQAAVKAFQNAHALSATGSVDFATRTLLNGGTASSNEEKLALLLSLLAQLQALKAQLAAQGR